MGCARSCRRRISSWRGRFPWYRRCTWCRPSLCAWKLNPFDKTRPSKLCETHIFTPENVHPYKIFTPGKIFTPEKYSPLENYSPPEKYSPPEEYSQQKYSSKG